MSADRIAALALVLLLGGCAGITWPVGLTIAGAVLGFGAKALDLDKAILAPVCPAPAEHPDDNPVHLIDI